MAKTLLQIEDLDTAIVDMLTDYKDGVANGVYRVGSKAIKEIERLTIDTAPIGNRKNASSHFRESIASKSERDRLGNSTHTWYVKAPNYRLTHLIVKGHAKANGGRTRANPFLKNAVNAVLPKFEEDVERVVRRGK